jgi:glycine hydroxymethyltransferase
VTSGIRLGTPAGTTRGFGVGEFREIGHLISDVLDGLAGGDACPAERQVKARVAKLCERFPIYG